LKPQLAAGGCAFGTMTFEFFTPGYPAICREAGSEFILYDIERLIPNRVRPDQEQARYCGETEIETHEADQETEGDVGRAVVHGQG
jgi:hypothetical protein